MLTTSKEINIIEKGNKKNRKIEEKMRVHLKDLSVYFPLSYLFIASTFGLFLLMSKGATTLDNFQIQSSIEEKQQ